MKLPSQFLTGKTNQVGTGNHGDVIEDKDDQMEVVVGVCDPDGGWHDGPEYVADSRGSACRAPTDSQEASNVDATPATLSCWLNSSGGSDSVGNGVVTRQRSLDRGMLHIVMTGFRSRGTRLEVIFVWTGEEGLIVVKGFVFVSEDVARMCALYGRFGWLPLPKFVVLRNSLGKNFVSGGHQ